MTRLRTSESPGLDRRVGREEDDAGVGLLVGVVDERIFGRAKLEATVDGVVVPRFRELATEERFEYRGIHQMTERLC